MLQGWLPPASLMVRDPLVRSFAPQPQILLHTGATDPFMREFFSRPPPTYDG